MKLKNFTRGQAREIAFEELSFNSVCLSVALREHDRRSNSLRGKGESFSVVALAVSDRSEGGCSAADDRTRTQRLRWRRALRAARRILSCSGATMSKNEAALLARRMEQVVLRDMDSALDDEAAIANGELQRAREMCLARNMKNRAKRERKRDKVRAATLDALFMTSQARCEDVCEASADEKAAHLARRQGALHRTHEAMAHALSGEDYAEDGDPVICACRDACRRIGASVSMMQHLYQQAVEEHGRAEVRLAKALAERDSRDGRLDKQNAESAADCGDAQLR